MNLNPLAKLRQRQQLKEDLTHIIETPHGERFFQMLLRECHVTKPVFHTDTNKLRECEGRRRFAMSLLSLLSQDNPQVLIDKLEQEEREK